MRIRQALGAAGAVLAVGVPAAVWVTGGGARTAVLDLGPLGVSEVGAVLDPVRGVLVGLVLLVSTLVAGYVAENLRGQRRVPRFVGLLVLLVASLLATVVAPSLLQLAVAWTLTTVATAGLVAHAGTASARTASRRVRRALLLGDLAVWTAVVVAALAVGTTTLSALVPSSAYAVAAATLLVAAGLVRSAQVPAHRWLQETTEAPSPVSALLHAGVVNAVGVVALVAWPLVAASGPARGLLVAAGAATIVLGWATSKVRPDVKGRLVSSTSAQMGYLAVVAGLGLPAAALVHVVGHGLWKAALFLGAGSHVDRVRRTSGISVLAGRGARFAAASVAAIAVVIVGVLPAPGDPLTGGPAPLLLLAAAALTAATAAASGAAGRRAGILGAASAVLAAMVYVVVVRVVETALATELPSAAASWGAPGAGLALAVVVALLVAATVARRLDREASIGGRSRLVAWAARQTLPSAPVRRRDVRPLQTVEAADPRDVVVAVDAASAAVGPLWPLHAFVASNPLSGLEALHVRDALRAASASWGSRPGIDASLFRLAVESRAVDADVLDGLCRRVAPGSDVMVASPLRTRTELVRALLLSDDADEALVAAVATRIGDLAPATRRSAPTRTPGERAASADARCADLQQRSRDLVSMHAARLLGDPSWPVPQGIWAALRADGVDRALGVRGGDELIAALPVDATAALAELVAQVAELGGEPVPVMTRLLARDPGFVGHLQWRRRVGLDDGVDLVVDLLVARLALDVVVARSYDGPLPVDHDDSELVRSVAVLVGAMGLDLAATTDQVLLDLAEVALAVLIADPVLLRLTAWEDSYREPVLAQIAARAASVDDRQPGSPAAQVITCIDVRSEPLRRALEARGPWETFGAAGFFGLPLRHVDASGVVSDRLPALLLPDREVGESYPVPAATRATAAVAGAAHGPDHVAGAAFALADAAGWAAGPWALLRTFAPRTADALARRWRGAAPTGRLELEGDDAQPLGFSLDELADHAQAFLSVVGLDRPAPLVLLLGHGAHVTNQPHVAAYDCGACGGNPGDVSARAMAQVLNDPRVRGLLAERGAVIPEGTVFVGALHGTTDGTVEILDGVPASHADVMRRLLADLADSARRSAEPSGRSRAADWSQARPEWGLARNAALVIGPRALTAGLDLDGRVFLHSYRHDLDVDGSSLEFLLTAPMVVAQWISTQYWATVVDPERFGAGDKTLHDIVCRADGGPSTLTGVLLGARGDLRTGLPWQAVSEHAPVDGSWTSLPHHDPLRLLVVVHASLDAIDAVLARRPEAGRLVAGEWLALVAVDPGTGRLHRRDALGGWAEVDPVDVSEVERLASRAA
ncbi:MAG: putative inorganic carbon transporter subunit DabA [Candidatus Nanopelagicales bacterium]